MGTSNSGSIDLCGRFSQSNELRSCVEPTPIFDTAILGLPGSQFELRLRTVDFNGEDIARAFLRGAYEHYSGTSKVFESWNSWGYQAISFELVTASGQRVVVSRKNQDFDKNFPSTFIVPPGENQVYSIRLNEEDWKVAPELRFANAEPLPVSLTAIYQLARTSEATRENVWVGRTESKSYHLQLDHGQPL